VFYRSVLGREEGTQIPPKPEHFLPLMGQRWIQKEIKEK